MNGRVYDYNLGRFLSVDPFIQDPDNSQSMNPYSYIMNNPLSGSDPSGYVGCAASRIKSKCNNTPASQGGRQEATQTANSGLDGKMFAAISNGIQKAQSVNVQSNVPTTEIGKTDRVVQAYNPNDKEPDSISNEIDADNFLDFNISQDEHTITFNMSYQCKTQRACYESKSAFESIGNKALASDGKEYELVVNMRIYTEGSEGNPDFYLTDIVYKASNAGEYVKIRPDVFLFGTSVEDTIGFNRIKKVKNMMKPKVGTAAHELGHRLGLHHQKNNTDRLMSYSRDKKPISGDRIKDLISAYRKINKE
jgi:hypothetical protein